MENITEEIITTETVENEVQQSAPAAKASVNEKSEFEKALGEMDWTLIAFRTDDESKKDLEKRMAHWQELAAAYGGTVDLKKE